MTAKTAVKTARPSPRSGYALPVGAHPGNTGGKKGRSGRKPNWLKDLCDELLADPAAVEVVRKAMRGEEIPASTVQMWRAVADRAHGKPKETVELSGEVATRIVRVPEKAQDATIWARRAKAMNGNGSHG